MSKLKAGVNAYMDEQNKESEETDPSSQTTINAAPQTRQMQPYLVLKNPMGLKQILSQKLLINCFD